MADTKKISREGYEKLVNELKDLKQNKLPETLKILAEAKEMGDLSENFDYKAALEEKDFINSRMKEIEELIDNVEIIDDTPTEKKKSNKVVDFWSKVTLQVENDKPYEVTIVGSGEIKIQDGEIAISLESPIGQAIRGKAVGEVAKMRLNNVKKDVTILAIQ